MQAQLQKSFGAGVNEQQARMAAEACQSMIRGLGIQPGIDMQAAIQAGELQLLVLLLPTPAI